MLGQEPEVAVGGCAAGQVAVGGHDGGAGHGGQLPGLGLGQGGPERGEAEVAAAGGQGDRVGVHGSFGQDRDRALVQELP